MALAFSGLSGRIAKGRFAKAVKKPAKGTLDRKLVVSIPLKNMKVSWDDYSQYIEK
jgi:hypothetical protein